MVIFVLKVHYNDENVVHRLLRVTVAMTLATQLLINSLDLGLVKPFPSFRIVMGRVLHGWISLEFKAKHGVSFFKFDT